MRESLTSQGLASYVHTIRLRHPWQSEPCEMGARWSRNFNWPAGILPGERASLVIEGLPTSARVSLSGTPLTPIELGRFEVTSLLVAANKLVVELVEKTDLGGTECPYEVRLEIEEVD